MSDDELKKLGVSRLGDRVILRNLCKNAERKFRACMARCMVAVNTKYCFEGYAYMHQSISKLQDMLLWK